ncbi:MAG: PP2C family protein-serine/threonine phosphatase [Cyclobacteriaceae bacterium]
MIDQKATSLSPKEDLQIKQMELNALLEVTQAINNNLAESALYKIYRFTLLGNLGIGKLSLFVLDQEWTCKVSFGTKVDYSDHHLPESYHELNASRATNQSDTGFEEFGQLFPIMHKQKLLAVLFIGNLPETANTTFLMALTNIIIVAIENKKLARRELEQEAFRKEMEIARQVQHFLFPKDLPSTDILDIAASYFPHNEVGGDYYDYIPIDDDQFLVCIADVSGKGVPAALLMSNFQASLRMLLRKTDDFEEIVFELNRQVNRNGNAEIFITFFAAIYNYSTQKLRYVNCGHNPPILRMGEELSLLEVGTTVLGMFDPLPFFTEGNVDIVDTFSIYSYTDGITETLNEEDEEFGQERFIDLVKACCKNDLAGFNKKVISTLDEFRGATPYKDDITLLTCKVSV